MTKHIQRTLIVCAVFYHLALLPLTLCAAVEFRYDSLNRLTNVNYGNGSVISYTYDPAGNRLTYSAPASADATAPAIAIASPTAGPSFPTTSATVSLSGTASDNVGVTLVTWANDRGGLGTATGTNSWSIAGVQLKYGTNNLSVTAWDAAGNSTPATLAVIWSAGTAGTTTNTAFAETGSGSIDTNKWTSSGNTVTMSGGTMQVLTTVTDQGGVLTSKPIPINQQGDITITRRVKVHYGGQQYVGRMEMKFGGLGMSGIYYANYIWSSNPSYGWSDRYGFYISRSNAYIINQSATTNLAGPFTPIWDTWFSEKVVYSPDTGILQYFTNNTKVADYNIGIMPPTNNPTLQLTFNAWGWYTGHQQIFSNLVVSQVVPASPMASARPSQIAGYNRLANGVFRLTMNGEVGSNYVIYASSDLKYWTPLYTNTVPAAGLITFVDPSSAGYPQRFYRAVPFGTAVTVVPPPPTPQLTGISKTAGGMFEFTLNGPVGANYVVQVSTNLVNWVNLSTNAIPGSGVSVFDFPILPTQPQKFYRALPTQ